MIDKSVADNLFTAMINHSRCEWETDKALLESFDIDPFSGDWPFTDIWYDDYDYSFEFGGVDPAWTPTEDQLKKALALGFNWCWFNYTDGTDRYASHDTPLTDPRKREHPHIGSENTKLLSKIARLEKELAVEDDRKILIIDKLDDTLKLLRDIQRRMDASNSDRLTLSKPR